MYYLILAFFAFLPTFLVLRAFLKRDSQKAEPAGLIARTFFLGILSILPAVVMEMILSRMGVFLPPLWHNFFQAFLVAGLCEEAVKMWVVRGYTARRSGFDEITDGIVYTVTAGLGFAFYENMMYGMGSSNTVLLLLLRGITSVPLHALSSGFMGYFIGRSYFTGKNYFGRGLFYAVLIHGLYDFILFSPLISDWLIIPLLIILYPLLFRLMRKAQNEDRQLGLS
ncbi:MAG: PrsW family intramembrane metalloprotease [Spirochaetales bacterium]|nr:PrsW family intramembrane metalloprotease [Spirochaetales bacterium]